MSPLLCRGKGFTLIEIAIGIAVISILLLAVFKSVGMIEQARVQDTLAIVADLSSAARAFKQRYHYLPGDLQVSTASPEIPDVPANCASGGVNYGTGDGVIDLRETLCVPAHLFAAGYIKGGTAEMRSPYGSVSVIANANSNVATGANPLPITVVNVMEFASLPCAVAMEVDRKVDDGNLATGRARASVAACTPQSLNDPVPYFAMSL